MKKISAISKYILLGTIPLLFLLYSFSTVHSHIHILSDGQVIVHSHPDKLPDNGSTSGHSHTRKEILFWSHVFNSLTLSFISFALYVFLEFLKKIPFLSVKFNKIHVEHLDSRRNKAPPFNIPQ